MNLSVLSLSLLLLADSALWAQPTAVHCDKLLEVQHGAYMMDALILIDSGKITDVGPASKMSVPSGVNRIDAPGICLPGLIDVHDHLTSDPIHAGYEGLGPVSYTHLDVYKRQRCV